MIARTKTQSVKAPLVTALTALVLLLATGPVGALYPPNGAKPTGVADDPYMNPDDGMCVVGVAADGTMLVDWSITEARDCVAYTTGLGTMTGVDITASSTCGPLVPPTGACNTQPLCTRPNGSAVWNAAALKCFDVSSCLSAGANNASCIAAGNPLPCCTGGGSGTCGVNDGYRHAFAMTNTCVNAADPTTAISLVDLDRTLPMCQSKGGTTLSPIPGTCVAYGWVYRNRNADGPPPTLPVTGVGVDTTDGVQASAGLGFCYTAIRMTGGGYTAPAAPYNASMCPSAHNAPTTAPAGEWIACGSSATGCQTPQSYDAGLGWSFTGGNCVYNFGIAGPQNVNVINAAGAVTPLGTVADLTGIDNQGDCLAAGYSWDNWLPFPGPSGIRTSASGGDYAGMPLGAQIVKFDALTPIEGGGGEFFSGTGFNCLRCHADQSRAYQERNKPGFVKTRHQKAGDAIGKPFQPFFNDADSSWGLQGVQCTMCHSTARPSQDDLIQVVPAGVVGPPAEGAPKLASGHNQTEYGAHLLDICYTCHGTPAQPPLDPTIANPAEHIPVFNGDFETTLNNPGPATSNLFNNILPLPVPPTVGGLAPIMNQFLNSPHAQYAGSSLKVDIGNKDKYGSSFEGYVCRTSNGIGAGSIITTVYRNGVAEKIPNLDSTDNPACTNPADGSATSGAGGFWVKDGETSPGVPNNTAQGNCMTCHDVHWALASSDPESPAFNPEGEPFRRECPTCHVNPGTSASGAPQIDLATINHLKTAGTPLENWLTKPEEACETCHMPKSGGPNSSPMHLWRINTDPNYQTMGATEANTAPDVGEGYPDAAWVDIEHACGQCHGTDGITAPVPGVPPRTTEALATVAKGMHSSAAVSYFVNFNIGPVSGLQVPVIAFVDCGGVTCPSFTYDWDWGDGTHGPGTTESEIHTYASGGSKSITLTVLLNGSSVGSATRSVRLTNPDLPPTVDGTCTPSPDTWQMQVADNSTDDGPDADALEGDGNSTLKIVIDWGDGSTKKITTRGAIVNHTYLTKSPTGTYTVTQSAIDSKLQKTSRTCEATVAPFQITGMVVKQNGTLTPVGSAYVRLMKGSTTVKYKYTLADGNFAFTNLKPAAYTVVVTKTGFTFPATPITVGPDSLLDEPPGNNVIIGTKP